MFCQDTVVRQYLLPAVRRCRIVNGMDCKPIETACEIVEGQANLARLLNITPSTVNQWVKGVRPVPAERCPSIERLVGGKVRCEALRPDVEWSYLRGTDCVSTAPAESSPASQ
jgi:DNA-binding transcriptional regulator YdaS (Cro superfamily)